MAKVSPVSIKYMIYAKFSANGTIEKPDVIGALFGQTEGLLGRELEMRELQKEGKVGRIDVNLSTENSKTIGEIRIPSSLDKSETTIIAAAIETIERIGPTDAKIEIEKIEDIRGSKREYIIGRARALLGKIEGSAESRDIENAVIASSRLSRLREYGEEKLPAGDLSGKEIIVVEGRADVVNLMKNKVDNVVAMNGTILPEAIKKLSLDKEVTLFVDGDRGGWLIVKNAIDNANVDYVAIAPDGKEVEELTEKEILICLRKKIPAREFGNLLDKRRTNRNFRDIKESKEKMPAKKKKIWGSSMISEKQRDELKKMSSEIEGTKKAMILDTNFKVVRRCNASSLLRVIPRVDKVFAVITDGKATQPIISEAEKAGCKYLAARNFTYIDEKVDIELVSF